MTKQLIDPTMDVGATAKANARLCRIGHCNHPNCGGHFNATLQPTEAQMIAEMPGFMQAMFRNTPPVKQQPVEAIDVGGTHKDWLRERRVRKSLRTPSRRRSRFSKGCGAEMRSLRGVLGDSL